MLPDIATLQATLAGPGAHEALLKRVLAEARDEDMVEFTSVAGLPARAVATPWLKAYLKIEDRLQAQVTGLAPLQVSVL